MEAKSPGLPPISRPSPLALLSERECSRVKWEQVNMQCSPSNESSTTLTSTTWSPREQRSVTRKTPINIKSPTEKDCDTKVGSSTTKPESPAKKGNRHKRRRLNAKVVAPPADTGHVLALANAKPQTTTEDRPSPQCCTVANEREGV
mmetsp:Transcript_19049/g.36888  ORF Transcript_19049/g.36888 Transcript_19049/m.36888 type:complete len:147 (-) Transcript_19049:115-555(-)